MAPLLIPPAPQLLFLPPLSAPAPRHPFPTHPHPIFTTSPSTKTLSPQAPTWCCPPRSGWSLGAQSLGCVLSETHLRPESASSGKGTGLPESCDRAPAMNLPAQIVTQSPSIPPYPRSNWSGSLVCFPCLRRLLVSVTRGVSPVRTGAEQPPRAQPHSRAWAMGAGTEALGALLLAPPSPGTGGGGRGREGPGGGLALINSAATSSAAGAGGGGGRGGGGGAGEDQDS